MNFEYATSSITAIAALLLRALPSLASGGTLDAARPRALVYEVQPNGSVCPLLLASRVDREAQSERHLRALESAGGLRISNQ